MPRNTKSARKIAKCCGFVYFVRNSCVVQYTAKLCVHARTNFIISISAKTDVFVVTKTCLAIGISAPDPDLPLALHQGRM